MPREICIKRNALVITGLVLAGLGTLVVALQIPEIRREIKIWRM
jgi:hypothetical protein